MSVLAPSVAVVWKLIEAEGLDPAPLFAEEGLSFELPIEPGTRVDYLPVDRVRARVAEMVGDPAFGLKVARHVHPSHLGALGYAWLASSSMRTAFMRLQRYVRVLNDQGRVKLETSGGQFQMTVAVAQDSLNARVRDDAQAAVLMTLCRMNLGERFKPDYISIPHPEPDDRGPYERFFRCPLRFNAKKVGIGFPATVADATLPSANPMLAQMNERIANRRLAALDVEHTPNRVRAEIMEQLPNGNLSDESVAEALHMTSRTLHRRLKEHDTSFRDVLGEVRRELAEQYIADPTLTLTEITFLLGFAEASSFSRAFRRWTGQSPSAAREAQPQD